MNSKGINLKSLVALWLLGFFAYANSLVNGFVFDDILVVRDNYFIKSFERLPLLWDSTYFERFGEQSYRPLVSLTYFFDYCFWGLSPFGYHLDNLILHLMNVSLVWIFLRRLFGDCGWIFFASALFVLHSMMTESVNAVGFREELLTVFCGMVSLIFFVEMFRSTGGIRVFCMGTLSILAFFVGTLAKENMLVFPVLTILVYFQLCEGCFSNLKKRYKVYLAGLTAALLIYIILRFFSFHNPITYDFTPMEISLRIRMGVAILGYYSKLLLFPLPLTADYTFPTTGIVEWIRQCGTFTLLTGATVWVWRWGNEGVRFGWWWFLISLVPTLNIYPINHPIAERYIYFPGVGAVCFFASGLWQVLKGKRLSIIPAWTPVFFGGLLLAFSALTVDRNMDWKSSDLLWLQASHVTPKSSRAMNGIGLHYLGQENIPKAIEFFKSALELDPYSQKALSNLGLAYHKASDNRRAEEVLRRGLRLYAMNRHIMINLGRTLADSGKHEEALSWFKRVIDSGFRFAEPYLARGSLLADMGHYDEAYRDFKEAAKIRPDYPETWNNMGAILGEQKQFAEAVKIFRRALIVDPQNKESTINLALAHYFLKDYENALKYAKMARGFGVILPEYLASALKL